MGKTSFCGCVFLLLCMNAQLALETGLENQSSHLTSDLDKGPGQKNSQFCVSLPNSKEWSKEELWLDLTTLNSMLICVQL